MPHITRQRRAPFWLTVSSPARPRFYHIRRAIGIALLIRWHWRHNEQFNFAVCVAGGFIAMLALGWSGVMQGAR